MQVFRPRFRIPRRPRLAWMSQASGDALSLTAASSQYASAGNPAELQITGDLTIECRVKFDSLPTSGNSMSLISKLDNSGGAGNCSWYFRLKNVSGTQQLQATIDVNDGSLTDRLKLSKDWTPSTGTWYAVRASFDVSAGTGKLFIDGADQSAAIDDTTPNVSTPYTIFDSSVAVLIGAYVDGAGTDAHLDGDFDAPLVANTYTSTASEPLTTEPESDYLTGMAGLWNFNNGSRLDEVNGNNLTLVNSPAFAEGYPWGAAAAAAVPVLSSTGIHSLVFGGQVIAAGGP